MKKTRYYRSFEEYEENTIETVTEERATIIDENGWLRSDMCTRCKSYKTVVRRFFKALSDFPEFAEWADTLTENAASGIFSDKCPKLFAYGIEQLDEDLWYIFLNIKQDTTEQDTNNTQEDNTMKNTTFTMIAQEVRQDADEQRANTAFYINNGFYPSWANEHHTDTDRGLKDKSTARRWEQYSAGEITRKQAVEYTITRATREIEKNAAEKLAQLERVAAAPDMEYMSIYTRRTRAGVAYADVYSDHGHFTGSAGGWGYDKESACVADALNQSYSVLKALYTLKEKALKDGKTDRSETACTGRNNTECCGYGAGYTAIPYFEGGVGMNSLTSLLNKCGYVVNVHYGRNETTYTISRKEG